MLYEGSCHCGAVRFEVEAPDDLDVEECNCSICSKSGFLHLIRPIKQFNLVVGEGVLTTYSFNTRTAKHTFCSICGVKPFYVPRSNPNGISVNARCLDTTPRSMRITQFDGQNWEQNAHRLASKSQDSC